VLLKDFVGRWSITRTIDDSLTRSTAGFEGQCIFTPRNDDVEYAETGMLYPSPGRGLVATRKYLWHQDVDFVVIRFDDGRPFHRFNCRIDAPGDTHLCGRDTYRVAYDFSEWPVWSSIWQVTGPRKNYTMVSEYVPLDSRRALGQNSGPSVIVTGE
jgi:hypothetical protein